MERMLGDLGFQVRRCGSGGHRVFSHPKLRGFTGGNYNGGHGRNDQLKASYVRNVIRILEDWEHELRAL
jgi:hypothetical protein